MPSDGEAAVTVSPSPGLPPGVDAERAFFEGSPCHTPPPDGEDPGGRRPDLDLRPWEKLQSQGVVETPATLDDLGTIATILRALSLADSMHTPLHVAAALSKALLLCAAMLALSITQRFYLYEYERDYLCGGDSPRWTPGECETLHDGLGVDAQWLDFLHYDQAVAWLVIMTYGACFFLGFWADKGLERDDVDSDTAEELRAAEEDAAVEMIALEEEVRRSREVVDGRFDDGRESDSKPRKQGRRRRSSADRSARRTSVSATGSAPSVSAGARDPESGMISSSLWRVATGKFNESHVMLAVPKSRGGVGHSILASQPLENVKAVTRQVRRVLFGFTAVLSTLGVAVAVCVRLLWFTDTHFSGSPTTLAKSVAADVAFTLVATFVLSFFLLQYWLVMRLLARSIRVWSIRVRFRLENILSVSRNLEARRISLDILANQRYVKIVTVRQASRAWSVVLVPVLVAGTIGLWGYALLSFLDGGKLTGDEIITALEILAAVLYFLVLAAQVPKEDRLLETLLDVRSRLPCAGVAFGSSWLTLRNDLDSLISLSQHLPLGFTVLGISITWSAIKSYFYVLVSVAATAWRVSETRGAT